MNISERLTSWSMIFVPLLALYAAFELYGFLGLVLTLSYMLIVPTSIIFYSEHKRRKIRPKTLDSEEYEKYNKKEIEINLKELKSTVFLWFIPLSFIIIIYLYFEVEYGVLFALLYILFYAYKAQLNLEVLKTIQDNKEYYPTTKDGTSMDALKEEIEILQNRLDKLYDLSGFNAVKLSEIESNKERVAIIDRLWDIDLERNWIDKLWQWADLVGISEYEIPRDKDKLLENISYHMLHLDFNNMNINTIPHEIGYLHTGTYLDCSINNLSQIPKEVGNITDLEILNLRLNEINHIPSELGNLKNLRTLDISSNRLLDLPIEITSIPYLDELILHNNPIKRLPNELHNMKYLKKVTIDSSVEVSSEIKDFLGNKLEIIDIGWMQGLWDWADIYNLNENIIPRNKTDLLNLESLKVTPFDIAHVLSASQTASGNTHINIREDSDITKLPRGIGNMVNLKELVIDYTRITKLPKELGNLINLEVLSLDHTNIGELPIEIGNLKNLKKLLIRNTKITELPKEIQDLKNLKIWSVDRYI